MLGVEVVARGIEVLAAHSLFPYVGHTVAVGIGQLGLADIGRPATHVGLCIDESARRSLAA